jgi:hypothetical protein
VCGIERSGAEVVVVVVVLARREGVRISGDDDGHEAWRRPWQTRAAERRRAHEGGRRSSKRAAAARLGLARCGIGGSVADAARMHDAVVNLATVTTNSAGFSAMCPLLDTLCSRFQAEPGHLHPPSLSTSY